MQQQQSFEYIQPSRGTSFYPAARVLQPTTPAAIWAAITAAHPEFRGLDVTAFLCHGGKFTGLDPRQEIPPQQETSIRFFTKTSGG